MTSSPLTVVIKIDRKTGAPAPDWNDARFSISGGYRVRVAKLGPEIRGWDPG